MGLWGCRGTSLAYENTALGSDRRCWHYTSDGKERIGRINVVSNKTGKDLLTENIQKMLNRNVEDELLRKPLRQNSDGMIIKTVEKSISSNIKETLGNYLVFAHQIRVVGIIQTRYTSLIESLGQQ